MAGLGPTFPLHRLVWANQHRELEAALHSRKVRPCRGSDPVGFPRKPRCQGTESTPQLTCPCCAPQLHPDYLGPALSKPLVTCPRA